MFLSPSFSAIGDLNKLGDGEVPFHPLGISESLLIMDFVKPVKAVLVTFLDKVN